MTVLLVTFLVTLLAYSVTPNLECWKCEAELNKDGTHPCDYPGNFTVVKCKNNENVCKDYINLKSRHMVKTCTFQKNLTGLQGDDEDGIWEMCNTTKCNTKGYKDYFSVFVKSDSPSETLSAPSSTTGVTSCWTCGAIEHCNDPRNFIEEKCEEFENVCLDLVDKEKKYMFKTCASEEDYDDDEKNDGDTVIREICNTTKCNTKRYKDYVPTIVEKVTSCWGCQATFNEREGTHFCDEAYHFQVLKCAEHETMCIDMVYKERKLMHKNCISEEFWKYYKPYLEDEKGIWEICNTTQCNTKRWKDYFPGDGETNGPNKTISGSSSTTGVTSCWGCFARGNKNGTHSCNDPNNFKVKKCKKRHTMCIDLVYKESKLMEKTCASEGYVRQLKPDFKSNDVGFMEICNTTQCNTKVWKDYFPDNVESNVPNKPLNISSPSPSIGVTTEVTTEITTKVTTEVTTTEVTTQDTTPELECWECNQENKDGTPPCDYAGNFTTRKCHKNHIGCVDLVFKKQNYMVKTCASEKYIKKFKPIMERQNDIFEMCNTTRCNTKRWKDYFPDNVESNGLNKPLNISSPSYSIGVTSCWGCSAMGDKNGTHFCNDPKNFEVRKCKEYHTMCIDLVYKESKLMEKFCANEGYVRQLKPNFNRNNLGFLEICNTTQCNTKVWKDYFPDNVESNSPNKTLNISSPSSSIGVTPDLECWGCTGVGVKGKHPCNCRKNFKLMKCGKNQNMCVDLVDKEKKYMNKTCMSEEDLKQLKSVTEGGDTRIFKICNTTKCNTKKYKDYTKCNGPNKPLNIFSPPSSIGVTSCWGCFATEDKNGRHFCNDPKNFKVKKCKENETMCLDVVYKENKYMAKTCTSAENWIKVKRYVETHEGIWEICNTTQCNTKVWKDYFTVTVESDVQNKTLDLSTPSTTVDVTEVTTTEVTTTEITTTQDTTPDLECWGCTGVGVKGKHPCNCQKKFKLMKCGKNQNMCVDLVDKEKKYMNKTCMSEEDLKQLIKSVTEGGDKSIFKICNTTKCNTKKYKDYTKCNGLDKTYKLPATPGANFSVRMNKV